MHVDVAVDVDVGSPSTYVTLGASEVVPLDVLGPIPEGNPAKHEVQGVVSGQCEVSTPVGQGVQDLMRNEYGHDGRGIPEGQVADEIVGVGKPVKHEVQGTKSGHFAVSMPLGQGVQDLIGDVNGHDGRGLPEGQVTDEIVGVGKSAKHEVQGTKSEHFAVSTPLGQGVQDLIGNAHGHDGRGTPQGQVADGVVEESEPLGTGQGS